MRTIYLDCGMGAAGDMITAALYELLNEEDKHSFIDKMNGLGIPKIKYEAEKMTKCGIVGTHMVVTVDGVEEADHAHNHDHDHAHSHHHHTSMADIEKIFDSLHVSQEVRANAVSVYKLIAEAESAAHGVEVSEIHFHEVGSMDAIADVTAVCLLLEMLKADRVIASSVHVGSGHVHCAHGILPVPAPATAYILKDVPMYGGAIQGELCTPTGAALLKHFVDEFGEMPEMKLESIGYGMGKKDFARANCVRALMGNTTGEENVVVELSCNVDDMTPEKIGYALNCLLDMGALEVFTVPVGMKKSRPGTLINVICSQDKKDEMVQAIFKHTTTIGIRENIRKRYTLSRSIKRVDTKYGEVRVKTSEGYGVVRNKYEYEDIASIATEKGISIDEVLESL